MFTSEHSQLCRALSGVYQKVREEFENDDNVEIKQVNMYVCP